jgi:catecholate siderophore receptor
MSKKPNRSAKRRAQLRRATGVLAASAALGLRLTPQVAAEEMVRTKTPAEVTRELLAARFEDFDVAAVLAARRPAADLSQSGEPPRPRRDEPAVLPFEIPPGPLGTVLAAYEKATGIEVELADETIALLGSNGVRGRVAPEAALRELLTDTGAVYRFTGQRRVRIELPAVEHSIQVTAPASASSPEYTEPLLDTPQSITVIGGETIEEQSATTLRDVLRNVSGISIQAGEGGVPAGDNLSIRGFNARTDLFLDGVRDIGGYTRDPFNVEQVEVIKGPASAYSGRGSTGGAVNLVSKTPGQAAFGSADLGLGTDGYGRATVDLNRPLAAVPGGALRLNAMWTDAGVPGRDEVESRRWGIAPSISLGLGTPTRLTIGTFYLAQDNVPDYGIPWVPDDHQALAEHANQPAPVDFENYYGLLARDHEETVTAVTTAELRHDFDDRTTLRSVVRHGSTDRDSVITAPRFAGDDTTDVRRTDMKSRDQEDTILAGQVDLLRQLDVGGREHHLVLGVEVAREESVDHLREEIGPEPPVADLFDPDPHAPWQGRIVRTGFETEAAATTTAVQAFDTVDLDRRWQISGGVRWERFDADFADEEDGLELARTDEMLSWRAGVVFKPRPEGSVYAGAGTSFNPSAEALRLRTRDVGLEPEESRSFEIGTKWELGGGRLGLAGAAFQTTKVNARVPGLLPTDPPQVLDGEERVRGFEMSVDGRLTQRWTSRLAYTFLDSEITETTDPESRGNALANTPEHSLSLWTTYRTPVGLEVGGGVQYVGDRFNNASGARVAPEYWLFDAMAAYPIHPQLTLRLNVQNLADERYIDRVGGGHFIPGPGRSVALTTSVGF